MDQNEQSDRPLLEPSAHEPSQTPYQSGRDGITPPPPRPLQPAPPRASEPTGPVAMPPAAPLQPEPELPTPPPPQPPAPTTFPPQPQPSNAVPATPPPLPPVEPRPTSPPAAQPPVGQPAPTIAPPQPEPSSRSLFQKLRGIFSFALFIGGIVVAALIINQFIFQSYYVDGTSMTPTLQNNDRLIIDKVSKSVAAVQGRSYIPDRGQIVVLDSSILDQNGNNEQLIKRVIGIPGDTIIIKDGVVTVKNAEHPDGFNVDQALGLHLAPTYTSSTIELTLPPNKVFVMGDNRAINGSFDSRAFGPIDGSQLQGRLLLRIFPVNKAGLFK